MKQESEEEAVSAIVETDSGVMTKVLAKLKKEGEPALDSESHVIQAGSEIIESQLRNYDTDLIDSQKVKRTGNSTIRKRQEIFEDAIGKIEESDGWGHNNSDDKNRPLFTKYI